MTAFDRFDPFERRIGEALEGIAPSRPLEYLDDIFRQTARTSQRARWTFPERWLKVDTTLARPLLGRNLPIRQLIVLGLLVALAAAALVYYVGSTKRLPAPFGPAANGQIIYGIEGDLYVRDTPDGASRLLLGGPSDQGGVLLSPDGQLFAYSDVIDGVEHAWVADADGSNPRQILDEPFDGLTFQWSRDSQTAVAVTGVDSIRRLWIAPADGSGARELTFDQYWPYEAVWDPTRPDVLLVRTSDKRNGDVDLQYVDATTGAILSTVVMTGANLYGPDWEFSGLTFSPDGSKIAYNEVGAEAAGEHFWAHVMNRDGTDDRPLPLAEGVPALYSQAWPVFSPDGRWIALESWVGQPGSGVRQLALAAADGSSPTRRVGPEAVEHGMVKVWSPDGTSVLIHIDEIDDMYLIDPITGESELLPWKSDFPDWQRIAP
jgi:Tol biopolymer transport system component